MYYLITRILTIAALLLAVYLCTPKEAKYHIMPVRAPQALEDVRIDIVDSRTDNTMIQVIIYYKGCMDRLNLKKNALDNLKELNKAVDKIITLRDKTGGC